MGVIERRDDIFKEGFWLLRKGMVFKQENHPFSSFYIISNQDNHNTQ